MHDLFSADEALHESARYPSLESQEDEHAPRPGGRGRAMGNFGSPSSVAGGNEGQPAERTLTPAVRETLYTQLQPLVRRLIRQYGTTPDLRDELPGEIYRCFVRLLEAYDAQRSIPVRPYLIRSLPPAVYCWARSRCRHQQREDSASERVGKESQDHDPSLDSDAGVAMRQVLEQLPAAIAALPQRQRQVVIARYFEGRSMAEIAAAMDIEVVSAGSLLRHATEGLRRRLDSPPLTGG